MNNYIGKRVRVIKSKWNYYNDMLGVVESISEEAIHPFNVQLDGWNWLVGFRADEITLYKVEPLPLPG